MWSFCGTSKTHAHERSCREKNEDQKNQGKKSFLHHLSEVGDQTPGSLLEHAHNERKKTLLLHQTLQGEIHQESRTCRMNSGIRFERLTESNFETFANFINCEDGGCYCSFWHQKFGSMHEWDKRKAEEPDKNKSCMFGR